MGRSSRLEERPREETTLKRPRVENELTVIYGPYANVPMRMSKCEGLVAQLYGCVGLAPDMCKRKAVTLHMITVRVVGLLVRGTKTTCLRKALTGAGGNK